MPKALPDTSHLTFAVIWQGRNYKYIHFTQAKRFCKVTEGRSSHEALSCRNLRVRRLPSFPLTYSSVLTHPEFWSFQGFISKVPCVRRFGIQASASHLIYTFNVSWENVGRRLRKVQRASFLEQKSPRSTSWLCQEHMWCDWPMSVSFCLSFPLQRALANTAKCEGKAPVDVGS